MRWHEVLILDLARASILQANFRPVGRRRGSGVTAVIAKASAADGEAEGRTNGAQARKEHRTVRPGVSDAVVGRRLAERLESQQPRSQS